jgi:hypothetical protein
MKELNHDILDSVAGGLSKSDQLNSTLTQVQSSIKDLASQNTNGGSNQTTTMMMLMMAMQNRQPTVVAGAPTVVAAAPAFSFRARIRF